MREMVTAWSCVSIVALLLVRICGSEDSDGPCVARIKYYHIQDMTSSFYEVFPNLMDSVLNASVEVEKQYPGSGFGFAGLWCKDDSVNNWCYHPFTNLTTADSFADRLANTSRYVLGGGYGGGSDGFTAIWHATFGDEVNWAFNDDNPDYNTLPEARIIAIGTDDQAFYHDTTGFSDNRNTNADAAIESPMIYDSSYNPTIMDECLVTGYPDLAHVAQAVTDANAYLIVFPMYSGAMEDPVGWWTNVTGPNGMNLGDRVTVAEVNFDQHDMTDTIISVVQKIGCAVSSGSPAPAPAPASTAEGTDTDTEATAAGTTQATTKQATVAC